MYDLINTIRPVLPFPERPTATGQIRLSLLPAAGAPGQVEVVLDYAGLPGGYAQVMQALCLGLQLAARELAKQEAATLMTVPTRKEGLC